MREAEQSIQQLESEKRSIDLGLKNIERTEFVVMEKLKELPLSDSSGRETAVDELKRVITIEVNRMLGHVRGGARQGP
eukprot:CAMPEP_0202452424 /NCGR_PEP_ID=MMETSP1360-20130828/10647_1 /ASSEMBLY_ACC=CAM_ASM_000848 /TAXON_ID=515479 /ORGANISM="Licmophora paradoxa, Strain CCMP2313" /LENGTH=77 /DNA_ID=CAMNT_0049071253 /DNA_START=47 /DNA_END=276 /DNA_ORIENTATION=+